MTSPLSPESVAQLVADLATKSAMINMGEKIAWGSDSGVMDAAADMLTTLAAENATLLAERDEALRLLDNSRQIERNVQSVREHEHKRAEAALSDLATRRASEAAALERVKVLTEALEEILSIDSYESRETFDGSNKHVVITKFGEFGQIAHAALTPTADKEPKI